MYYHTQELKYTTYGKIFPAPIESVDEFFLKPYLWLGKYCGYCPQIWLSRGSSAITGYNSVVKQKKSRFFGARRNFKPNVMFAFDIIKGFPLDYEIWCFCLNPLLNCKNPVKDGDDKIKRSFDGYLKDFQEDPYPPENGEVDKLPPSDILYKWYNSKNYEDFLSRYFFVENDQVVVPSLNLKVAKKVFCRDEKQVKALRHMGFIHDRIKILNSKQWI